MTSLGTTRLLLALLALVGGGGSDTASAACVDDWDGRWNNLFENTNDSHNIGSASSATSVSLSGEETTDLLDISEYFTVSLNSSGGINLTPKPSLVGVKDYPTNMREIGPGTVTVNCTGTSEEQTVTVKVRDANTASPQLSSSSYLVPVSENYPTQLAIFALNISATDYDGDPTNNAVTFSLEDGTGTFNLTPAEQTSTQPATYLTRLVLNRALDWSRQTEYQLTVTAQDRGGLKSTSDVIINVTDVDNMPPEFGYTGYTAEALDRKALGPLVVKPATISATDPDRGGPLKYTLLDLPSANWARYFALDADSAALSLVKEIPDDVTTPSEISLIVESQETDGELFVSRAVLALTVLCWLLFVGQSQETDGELFVSRAVLALTVLCWLFVCWAEPGDGR
ncbi:protocadherin-16-like isoform X1 [Amphibalanus amphitrite]|uniref:protocadherin-16-like isoform X1 n=1 Tax=Amphibalanus amphitrite TaxID=1232801 RepID=UPI001C906BC7|nr:protocadherin-16-like isoform X1 [Amphibalanus amphitrite]